MEHGFTFSSNNNVAQPERVFVTRETGNRGPLMLNASMTRALNFLDERRFIRGDDDHDLNRRAHEKFNAVSGHFPVGFYAPLHLGSTRKPDVRPSEVRLYDDVYRAMRIELSNV